MEDMLISLTQVEATRNGTLEKEKRDHAAAQSTHRGLSVWDYSPTAVLT